VVETSVVASHSTQVPLGYSSWEPRQYRNGWLHGEIQALADLDTHTIDRRPRRSTMFDTRRACVTSMAFYQVLALLYMKLTQMIGLRNKCKQHRVSHNVRGCFHAPLNLSCVTCGDLVFVVAQFGIPHTHFYISTDIIDVEHSLHSSLSHLPLYTSKHNGMIVICSWRRVLAHERCCSKFAALNLSTIPHTPSFNPQLLTF